MITGDERQVQRLREGVAPELTIRARGPEGNAGRVEASVYLSFLQDCLTSIRRIERRVRPEGAEQVRFQIGSMHTSAPTISLAPVAATPEQGRQVVSAYMRTIHELEECGSHPSYVDVPTLQSFRKVANYVGSGLSTVEFCGADRTVGITQRLQRTVERVLGMVFKSHGSFSGRLEYINAHSDYKCRIYPDPGPNYIECRFPEDLLPEAAQGLKRHVRITGTLYYYGFQAFPHRIDASAIEIAPPEETLPTIRDLWGMAPEVTGEQTVEDFVRGLREPYE